MLSIYKEITHATGFDSKLATRVTHVPENMCLILLLRPWPGRLEGLLAGIEFLKIHIPDTTNT